MKLTGIELVRVSLPLVRPFRASYGTEAHRDLLLVRAETPDAEGWGECVAMREPRYSPEYVDGAHRVIRDFLAPCLLAEHGLDPTRVGEVLSGVSEHRMAKAALESALLDAYLRPRGISLTTHLGGVRVAVDAGVSVGITATIPELLDVVTGYVAEGYRRVKLKISPGWDVEVVREVRERFGDDLALQVDANTAYSPSDIDHLVELDAFGLLLVEQPFAAADLLGHTELARRARTPVCLDESIRSAADAETAIALGACSIVNVKPGRVGGIEEARRVHDVCAARGVPVWCGGMLETGIGRAVNVALASMENFTLPGDLSASARYFVDDLTEPFVLEDGMLAVPSGPGIGVVPRPERLEECATTREWITAG